MPIKKSEENFKYNRLRVILADREMSQKELSELIDVDPATIMRICNNKNQPSIHLLYKIAMALEVSVCDLLTPIPELKKAAPKKTKKVKEK